MKFPMCRHLVLATTLLLALQSRAGELGPQYFSAKPGSLMKAKLRFAVGDKDLARAVGALVANADEAMKDTPPSVTQKNKLPPSGDKHDYMSLAPYFWPNPDSSNGLPYISHDGKVNPESKDEHVNDGPRISRMGWNIQTLALAYYFTTNDAYAVQAAKTARVWFLDPETRMNPNMRFAQAVLGANTGRGIGILEGRHISEAADALGLLAGSSAWTATDQKELNIWLAEYLDWIMTSEPGKQERNQKNNHGTWFDVQSARLALCLGRTNVAREIIEEAKQSRIAVQIEPDGKQPLELKRTTSFTYSTFNLQALSELATLGEHANVDLWHFTTPDHRSIRTAIEFMLPYLDKPPQKWPFEQIKEAHPADLLPVLRQAGPAYHDEKFEKIIAKYSGATSGRFQLLFVK